jgi:hypothetical protein
MGTRISFANEYMAGLRFSGSKNLTSVVNRMRHYSGHMTQNAAEKLIERINMMPHDSDIHPGIGPLRAIVSDGLERLARKEFPSSGSFREAGKLGLAFAMTDTKGLLALNREVEEMERLGIAERMPDFESLENENPDVKELSAASVKIEEIAESKTTFIEGFSWARPRSGDNLYSIKAPDIELCFGFPGVGSSVDLFWPVRALYKVSVRDVSELGDDRIERTLSARVLRNRRVTVVDAYLPIPIPSKSASKKGQFLIYGYIMSRQTNGDFMIMMKNNGETLDIAYLLREGEENIVLGEQKENDGTGELILFDPLPTDELLSMKRQKDPEKGNLVFLALPVNFDEVRDEVEDLETDRERNLTLFNIRFIGVSKDTETADFKKALNALEQFSLEPVFPQ